uniref:Peptidase C1A papain C-terminal domain-containing protein n=1 Tax=Romanomermis culicivorax TaxID=13658 RepID=A0A915K5N2_ROMCU
RPKPAPITQEHAFLTRDLPTSFDWRNISGVSYVSPVRAQLTCGSCYAFASMAMLEARYRIRSNNTRQPIFSPQDVIECSEYS